MNSFFKSSRSIEYIIAFDDALMDKMRSYIEERGLYESVGLEHIH